MNQSTFQLLRPECIQISQVVARSSHQPVNWPLLEDALGKLRGHLEAIDQLDDALTDYALFPLIRVFQLDGSSRPSPVTTAALSVLGAILRAGKNKLSQPEFAIQILLLLTNLLERQGKLLVRRNASEPEVEALCVCLQTYFSSGKLRYPPAGGSGPDPRLVISGTILAILFEVISSEDVSLSRISALRAIEALLSSHSDDSEMVRRYLPGLLSNLVKPFANLAGARWSFRALQGSLKIIEGAFVTCLDLQSIKAPKQSSAEGKSRQKWIDTNGPNLFSAMKQLAKVQDHEREEVRDALLDLSVTLLEIACPFLQDDLEELLVQTLVTLQARHSSSRDSARVLKLFEKSERLRVSFLTACNTSIGRLPSQLQSPDQNKRTAAFSAATGSLDLVLRLGDSTQTLALLSESILSSATLLMHQDKPRIQAVASDTDMITGLEDARLDMHPDSIFGSGLQVQNDSSTLEILIYAAIKGPLGSSLLESFSTTDVAGIAITKDTLPRMWVLKTCIEELRRVSGLKHNNRTLATHVAQALELAYSASLDVLRRPPIDEEADWRSQALALNFVSLRAEHELEAFRPELVYALYPILERVACRERALQKHAIKALRAVSNACGYQHPKDLVLSNSDYLINSVSIRLNTFDVRPESAIVLQLAIRLCGPAFLPYLGDVSESVFTILDMYHGYPRLVQSMFSVLRSILDQAPGGNMTEQDDVTLRSVRSTRAEAEVVKRLESMDKTYSTKTDNDTHLPSDDLINSETGNGLVGTRATDETSSNPLIARIMRQAQFYLTYEESGIRQELLKLLSRGLQVLRQDEDTLLPVINDLWPVTVHRLYDSEPFMIIEALSVLGTAVSCAGDFLSTRFEDEWPRLKRLFLQYRPLHSHGKLTSQKSIQVGQSQAQRVWTAMVDFITRFISSIRVSFDIEDDIIELFGSEARVTSALQRALKGLNADALWLRRHMQDGNANPPKPRHEQTHFALLPK